MIARILNKCTTRLLLHAGVCRRLDPYKCAVIAAQGPIISNSATWVPKQNDFQSPPTPFQYLGKAWGKSKGRIVYQLASFRTPIYVAPKGAFECLFGGLKLVKCAVDSVVIVDCEDS